MKQFTVWAYSPSQNQRLRQFNIEGGVHNVIHSESEANLWAESYAQQLNRTRHLTASDWRGEVVWIEATGLKTWVESQNNQLK